MRRMHEGSTGWTGTRMACALLALLVLAPRSAPAAPDQPEHVRFVLLHDVSPDGKQVVVAWRGDLWRAPIEGGRVERLTFHAAEDTRPVISPDGASIWFTSDRTGDEQVWRLPWSGGRPEQLTFHTEGSRAYDCWPDGSALLTRVVRDHEWYDARRFCRQPVDPDGRAELVFDARANVGRVSPDGKQLAYTREGAPLWRKGYHGDGASHLWVHDLGTDVHRPLTQHDRGDRWPVWIEGGKALLVASQENGTFNLWRVDPATGAPRRLTSFDDQGVLTLSVARDAPVAVVRVGMDLLRVDLTHAATAPEGSLEARPLPLVYEGPPLVDPVERLTLTSADEAAFTDDAREIALVLDGDLYVMDTELREPVRITGTPETEASPVFSPDHATLWFTSAAGGQVDIWRARRSDESQPFWRQTSFKVDRITEDDAVEHRLEIAPDGKHLVYVRGAGEVWWRDLAGASPKRLLTGWDEPDFSLSRDGRWIAYAVDDADFNRDVWIRAADDENATPYNVSRHPDHDGEPAFSPDGHRLAFVGRRWGEEADLVVVSLTKGLSEETERDRRMEKALEAMKGRKAKGAKEPGATPAPKKQPPAPAEHQAGASPLVGRWTGTAEGPAPIPPTGLSLVLVVTADDAGSLSGSLSVPGQIDATLTRIEWTAATGAVHLEGTTPTGALVADGKLEGTRIEGTWNIEGLMAGTFRLEREAAAGEAPAPAKDEPAEEAEKDPKEGKDGAEKAKKDDEKPVEIDFEGLADRLQRISVPDSTEGNLLWSPDGKRLAFRASVKGQDGLYTITFPDKLEPSRLAGAPGRGARWLAEPKALVWLDGGKPVRVDERGKATSYAFRTWAERDVGAWHRVIFDEAWRWMRDTFYDPRMGGTDWAAMRSRYIDAAAWTRTHDELEQVVEMMLGELNASHLGFSWRAPGYRPEGWRPLTGHLGLLFDRSAGGEGLLVRDVVRGSPAETEAGRVRPGERVLSIDGHPLSAHTDVGRLLTGVMERDVRLRVLGKDDVTRDVTLRPMSYATIRGLLYQHTLERTQAAVDERSGGRIGYLHVRGMDWPSFERFEQELYKVGHGKDGLIIDVRENGGGFTADHLLTCLSQPVHAFTVPRGGQAGYPQGRMVYARWTKPIVVLCNQNSFSNAEIFSHAIKALGRGRLVGVATAGGVISTGATRLRGGATLRLPGRGWFGIEDGADMELRGAVPDIRVEMTPMDEDAGRDPQRDAAVDALLEDLAVWDARPKVEPVYRSER
ncbi:MAG: S41 family peptidase [Planctomycetota bacterium]